jgi:hypothetical protein
MPAEDQVVEYYLNSRPRNVDPTRPTVGRFAIRLQHSQTSEVQRSQSRTFQPLFVQPPARRDPGRYHQFTMHLNRTERGYYHATRDQDHQEHGRLPQPAPGELHGALWGNGRMDSGQESWTRGRRHRRPGVDALEARYFEAFTFEDSV